MKETALGAESLENLGKKNITVAAMVQACFTLLSRIAGMVRDILMYHIFGVGFLTDAFNIAFTIPNVLRRFFAEGAFAVAFVPVFISCKEKQGNDAAQKFFKDAFGFLLLGLIAVTFLGVIFSRELVHLFAFGFSSNLEQLALTDFLTKWLFPYVFFVSLVALFGAYLQCHNKFAAMAASPIFFNLSMIFAMYAGFSFFNAQASVLALGVILGGLVQFFYMWGSLKKEGLWQWPSFNFKTESMRQLIKLLGPALFGVFVYQLNIIVLRQLASFLGEGQISYYYNADRLTQFATGVFGVSIATAALPELSRGVAKLGEKTFYNTLRFTMVITSFVITPCALGLMAFAYPIVSVLYVHGAFTTQDAVITSNTLFGFAPSLMFFSLSRPLIQGFYAQRDTKTPVMVGIITVILNLVIGILLLRYAVMGLALTLSISSFFQYIILLQLFKKKNFNRFNSALIKPVLAHLGLGALSCSLGLLIAQYGLWEQGLCFRNIVVLGALSFVSGLTYLILAYYFGLNEARKFVLGLRQRLEGRVHKE